MTHLPQYVGVVDRIRVHGNLAFLVVKLERPRRLTAAPFQDHTVESRHACSHEKTRQYPRSPVIAGNGTQSHLHSRYSPLIFVGRKTRLAKRTASGFEMPSSTASKRFPARSRSLVFREPDAVVTTEACGADRIRGFILRGLSLV